MNNKQPELTIFQGAPSIHVDQHRIEEEEAIEDQKRRQKELQLDLEREFDNISIDDEDDELDSTRHDRSSNVQQHSRDFPLRDDFTYLRNLVETKSRELEQISSLLALERKEHKNVIDEYEKRLAIAEAEKDRALMNRNQTHELLVENKGKLIDLNDQNEKHLSKIKSLERENGQLVAEIENTKIMLSDVQTKYAMVEKNTLFNAEKSKDQIIKQAQERHNAQIAMMQQQIDTLKSKYDDLEHSHKHLEIKYNELQKSREAILIEKSEIINQINRSLQDSQKQCQDLLSRPDMTQENRRLKHALQTMEFQNQELSMTINKLQNKIQEQTSEMEMMDSVINECNENNQSFAEMSKFLHRDPLKNINSTPMTADAKVKAELLNSVNNIKRKREEIKILEKQLAEKDEEIADLKRDESKLLIDLDTYRKDVFNKETKLNQMQKEMEKVQDELRAYENAKEQQKDLCKALEDKKNECDELRAMIEKFKVSESEFSNKLEVEQRKLEELTNKLVEARKKEVDVDTINKSIQIEGDTAGKCKQCDEFSSQIEKLETSNAQLYKSNEEYVIELSNLKHDLEEAHQTIVNLEEKIRLQSIRDREIEKLQEKAREFENFMRSTSRKEQFSSPSKDSQDSSTNTSNLASTSPADTDSTGRNYNECKIRDEMARIFANQIKTIEKRFIDDTKKLHNEIVTLSNELETKSTNLNIATEQLDLLKFTIVHEREEFELILKKRDESYKQNIEEYRKHIAVLNSQIDMIDDERKAIHNLKTQIEDERKVLSKKEEETLQKLKKLQMESSKIIEELNDKYKTAKKTALNYKQYSDDKEKHYRSECERIKNGYAEAVEKIQSRVNETLKEKEQCYNEKLKRMEQEYEFKIDILKGMLEKYQK